LKNANQNLRYKESPNIIDILLGRNVDGIVDSETLITEVRNRVTKSVNEGYPYAGMRKESEQFLRKNVLKNMEMVVMYVDIVCSTSLILNLPIEKLATALTTFAQEMAYVIKRHNGFILKYAGDAVIGYFIVKDHSVSEVNRAVACAESMIQVLKRGINPVLKNNGFPVLGMKIGIDHGINRIVRYGDSHEESHVDMLGPSLNIAAKTNEVAQPGQIIIGKDVYSRLDHSIKDFFIPLKLDEHQWNYRSSKSRKIYPVYAYIGK
jgi:adenylate cyclase